MQPCPHLVSEQHHDSVVARPRGRVFNSEGVIVILDDVKVDVSLGRAHHTRGTLDPNADISCKVRQRASCQSEGARGEEESPGLTLSCLAAVHSEVGWLARLQTRLVHAWTVDFDLLWVASLPDSHLTQRMSSWGQYLQVTDLLSSRISRLCIDLGSASFEEHILCF